MRIEPLSLLVSCALLLLSTQFDRSVAASASHPKPNIVLILTDDQGYGDASYNWPETDLRTPVMDRVAANEDPLYPVRVNPLLLTRSSIMTGTYSIYNGMWRGPGGPKTGEDGKIIKPDTRVVHDDVECFRIPRKSAANRHF